jgi:acylphosphatase
LVALTSNHNRCRLGIGGIFYLNKSMNGKQAFHAIIRGRVQGVYFRAFVQHRAVELGLCGYTRNLASGNEVEVQAEGDAETLQKLLEHLKNGPAEARVESLIVNWSAYSDGFSSFEIRY